MGGNRSVHIRHDLVTIQLIQLEPDVSMQFLIQWFHLVPQTVSVFQEVGVGVIEGRLDIWSSPSLSTVLVTYERKLSLRRIFIVSFLFFSRKTVVQ